jgi:hypothetical protein
MSHRKLRMVYNHWLAQERFRLRFPRAFGDLPGESVRRYMIEPVLQAVRAAYWQRNADGYRMLLKLARRLAPEDGGVAMLWRRRWCPLSALRLRDRLTQRALRESQGPAGGSREGYAHEVDDLASCAK